MCKIKRDSFVCNQNLKKLTENNHENMKNTIEFEYYLFKKIISNFFFGKSTHYGQN